MGSKSPLPNVAYSSCCRSIRVWAGWTESKFSRDTITDLDREEASFREYSRLEI
jgi:hypothetical protein